MSEQQELKEYRQGETVHLDVEVKDEHGVYTANVFAYLEGSSKDDIHTDLTLTGWPEGEPKQAVVVLWGTVEQHLPGVYVCPDIITENSYGALSRHDLDPPLRFRIVEHPDDVREGPEVLSVGEFY